MLNQPWWKLSCRLCLPVILAGALALFMFGFVGGVALAHDEPALAPGAPASQVFAANLSSASEVPATESIGTGRAVMTLITDTLYFRLFVADIDQITAAHIHEGAPGANGGIVADLFTGVGAFDATHPVSGTLVLTPTQVTKLLNGDYYINVHSTDFPAGEIRGQIGQYTPPQQFNALLLGRNETSPVTTNASGIARLTLVSTDTLNYQLSVSDIVSVTAQHIHLGPVGVAGGVIFPLPGALSPNNPISGTVTLSAKNLLDLLTGYYYVNVHTTANAPGEIRGQIGGHTLYQASLAGANEVPPVVNTVAGGAAVLALNADATKLFYRIMVDNIEDIQAAHIHLGAMGQNGPVVLNLLSPGVAFAPGAPISGTLDLTDTHVTALITGQYYINVHTKKDGSGEIRGQIGFLTPPTHFNALLTGAEQTPAVESTGLGLARLTYMPQLGTLHYTLVVSNITGTAAHIHLGPRGKAGGVIIGFDIGAGLDAAHPVGSGVVPNAKSLVDLLTGFFYVNVHTPAHPSGEIRGQIGGARLFHASLSGAEEVPPVDTVATGDTVLALDADTTRLHYRVMVDNITGIAASHIHRGALGTNGPVIHNLFTGGAFDPSNPISGTLAFNTASIFDLIAGNYYVNVHTATHGSGEIRGQVGSLIPATDYIANLTGDEEVPPKTTDAFGLASLALNLETNQLYYTVHVSDVVSVTAAHIHVAPAGQNGPVVFGFYPRLGGGPFDAANPIGGSLRLDGRDLLNLLTGYYYVNVHTVVNPGGEIRGQVMGMPIIHLPIIATQ